MNAYLVVQQDSRAHLEYAINKMLETGWQLVGGVSIASTGVGTSTYAQAMVRHA